MEHQKLWIRLRRIKELSLKDGELQIEDVQGPTGEGSLEARMEALEQEVFKYKKMA
jgi:hypothetical protein